MRHGERMSSRRQLTYFGSELSLVSPDCKWTHIVDNNLRAWFGSPILLQRHGVVLSVGRLSSAGALTNLSLSIAKRCL